MTLSHHVACEDARRAASSRTRFGPSSSGHQSAPSSRAGVLPSSRVRGRWNHLRTPTSLYAPARSATTKATKWSRTAIASGVGCVPETYLRVLDADTPTRPANSSGPKTSCNAGHSAIVAGDWSSAFAMPPTLSAACVMIKRAGKNAGFTQRRGRLTKRIHSGIKTASKARGAFDCARFNGSKRA